MRYIGLDLGSKTLGIAISDLSNTIASNYKTIMFKNENYDSLLFELKEIINDYNITNIVLGWPKNMNNTIGSRAEITQNFKEKIEKYLKTPVYLEDERLTSVISNQVLIGADMSRKKRKKVVDKIAASIILQSYLDRLKKEKEI